MTDTSSMSKFFKDWAQTFNDRDWDAHCAMYTNDIAFAVPPGPTVLNGQSELRNALVGFTTRFLDVQLSVGRVVVDGHKVAAEWEEVGTEAESGAPAVFKFCGMLNLRDGLISAVSRYGGRQP